MTPEMRELCARLRAAKPELDELATFMVPRNPNGPEAASAIEALAGRVEELEGSLELARAEIVTAVAFLRRGPGGENNRRAIKWQALCADLAKSLSGADAAARATLKEQDDA